MYVLNVMIEKILAIFANGIAYIDIFYETNNISGAFFYGTVSILWQDPRPAAYR